MNKVLRKVFAIALLAIFGLPFASALFALTPKSDSNLPACCRRDGKHHCMMSMAERDKLASNHDPQFEAPAEKCPFCPAYVAPAHFNPLSVPPIAAAIFGDLVSHPTGFAQTEAKRRVSQDRSNQKRGPPSQVSL